jgi:uncharacterized membrane protein YGL010W
MGDYFKRQLADYVEYHRDPRNGLMHVFGILSLFQAAVLPLSQWPVPALGAPVTVATIMVLPVLIYWLLLDAAIGTAILGAAIVMLAAAATIVTFASATVVWSMTAALIVIGVAFQIVGHRVFERRQPALLDNPTHLLLGPMFVMAKLFIAFGFRQDLARIIEPVPQQALRGSSAYPGERQGKPLPHS